jgi:hypothetical protein
LDFIKKRIQEFGADGFDISFENVTVLSPTGLITFDKNNQIKCTYSVGDKPSEMTSTITYDPNADFRYFTTKTSRHDGTLLFVLETVQECLNKIINLETCDKSVELPQDLSNCDFFYTIGDIIVVNEHSNRFSEPSKPWMQERTTVMIPVIFRVQER